MKTLTLIASLFIFFTSAEASAGCTYNGKSYSDNERVGPYVCQGGKWVRR